MLAVSSRPITPENASRQSDYPIETLFLRRWSPRAFHARAMPMADLFTILEAARWAPSAHNLQPWHFIYCCRGDAHWQDQLDLLDPGNAAWARQASALVFVTSQAVIPAQDVSPTKPSRTHSFDTGAAWAQMALQATALGYQAHAMAGIDYQRAQRALVIPHTHRLEIAVAIGRQANADQLPSVLRAREQPSLRRPLKDMVSKGVFAPARAPLAGEKS